MTTAQSNRERAGDAVKTTFTEFEDAYESSPTFQGYVLRHSENLTNVQK
jgi:ribosomal protein L19